MKKLLVTSMIAALLGTTAYAAWAQATQEQPPLPPAQQEMQDGDGGQMGGHGWRQGRGDRHGGRHGQGHAGRGGPGGHGMMIDANGDNIIGDSEAAMLADRGFQRLDRDASGELDEAEFTTVRKRGRWWNWSQAQGEGITEGLKAKFATLDADKNGKVTKAEFMADAQSRFAAADANKDGKVSPWEFFAQK
jgi:Spy/CpxP family protein refolding chaperone